MPFNRILTLLILSMTIAGTSALAQSTQVPVCDHGAGDYMACALFAGHVPDLRDVTVAANEREVRFWSVSGLFMPDQLLVIHQRGDTVTGKLLLIWSDSTLTSELAKEVCHEESWLTPAGSLCIGRFGATQHWGNVMRTLDAQGLSQLPGSPVPEQPCDRSPQPVRRGQLPGDRICAAMSDGFSTAVEVRTSSVYWRYDFQSVPDTTAPGFKRDQEILRILTCAARKIGDGIPQGTVCP